MIEKMRRIYAMPKTSLENLRKRIEHTIRKQLSDTVVDRVEVREDVDHDGDQILRVSVIFGGRQDKLDARATLAAISAVHDLLLAAGDERFPIFSYISRADAKRMNPAAA